MKHAVLLAGLLVLSTAPAAAEQLAFPGAEGAGRLALGGRGGRVLTVTTLEDGGPGSLRVAVETPGPRIIVFAVSGTIKLTKPLRIREGRVTIAGQSAPGDGITLRDHPLEVAADDVVIRYIRSRLGDELKQRVTQSGSRRAIGSSWIMFRQAGPSMKRCRPRPITQSRARGILT